MSDRPEPGEPAPFETKIRGLLDGVAAGAVSTEEALDRLRGLPFEDLGFAKVDHHRELRQGTSEIVYAEGKTPDQVRGIVAALLEGNVGPVLVTRADEAQRAEVRSLAERAGLEVDERPRSRAIAIVRGVPSALGSVLVVTAGTSDLPVAEEAALTASLMGVDVDLVADVGVAGLHRLAGIRDRLEGADALVVVAGMEGALASVVGGLVARPVVACPTSVGYGASFGGLAALLAMLSSCTPGVVCVDIDDGVGAGFAAALIARTPGRHSLDRPPALRRHGLLEASPSGNGAG
ncbi:MAG TPA: nickel pincer cofactor biosynthesis protein LarB [Actinomycetota bacterium]|nr:nickel pincer cofactor biosynthesis protein LarB [Actinomycetota bacterium]